MKLGILLGYSGKQINIPLDLIHRAEAMGYDSVWTAEAYGNDAVTAATWVLAQTRLFGAQIIGDAVDSIEERAAYARFGL